MTGARLVAEIPCTCKGGVRVVAVLPDGREFATDAASTSDADERAWWSRFMDRLTDHARKNLPPSERAAFVNAMRWLADARLAAKVCSDCGGTGALMRIWQDAA